jgi:hypothetical protein
MKNGRCRLHGGFSTCPKTPAGIERIRQANLKHGRYTAEVKAVRRQYRQLVKEARETLKQLRSQLGQQP